MYYLFVFGETNGLETYNLGWGQKYRNRTNLPSNLDKTLAQLVCVYFSPYTFAYVNLAHILCHQKHILVLLHLTFICKYMFLAVTIRHIKCIFSVSFSKSFANLDMAWSLGCSPHSSKVSRLSRNSCGTSSLYISSSSYHRLPWSIIICGQIINSLMSETLFYKPSQPTQ